MPCTARAVVGDYCDHVINRGNGCAEVFHAEGDYQAVVHLLSQASDRLSMRVFGPSAARRNWWNCRMSPFFLRLLHQ